MNEIIKEIKQRITTFKKTNSSADKAARYLNAEFEGCFYVSKKELWGMLKRDGKPEVRKLATFSS